MASNINDFVRHAKDVLGTAVNIVELDVSATVIGVYVSDCGLQYQVRYFMNGDVKTTYLFPFEITLKK